MVEEQDTGSASQSEEQSPAVQKNEDLSVDLSKFRQILLDAFTHTLFEYAVAEEMNSSEKPVRDRQ